MAPFSCILRDVTPLTSTHTKTQHRATVAMVGLWATDLAQDAYARALWRGGALTLGRLEDPTALGLPEAYRLPAMSWGEILRKPWWRSGHLDAWSGSVFLRPSALPGHAFVLGAFQAPVLEPGLAPPHLLETHLAGALGERLAPSGRSADLAGYNLGQAYRMPLWGPDGVAFSTGLPKASVAVVQAWQDKAVAHLKAGGKASDIRGWYAQETGLAFELADLALSNLAADPVFARVLTMLPERDAFDAVLTARRCTEREQEMMDTLVRSLIGDAA